MEAALQRGVEAIETASIELGKVMDQLDALSDRWMELGSAIAELPGELQRAGVKEMRLS